MREGGGQGGKPIARRLSIRVTDVCGETSPRYLGPSSGWPPTASMIVRRLCRTFAGNTITSGNECVSGWTKAALRTVTPQKKLLNYPASADIMPHVLNVCALRSRNVAEVKGLSLFSLLRSPAKPLDLLQRYRKYKQEVLPRLTLTVYHLPRSVPCQTSKYPNWQPCAWPPPR